MTRFGYFSMWVPIILTALGVILVITLRWFSYKERMALIAQGLTPQQKKSAEEKGKLLLAAGLILGLVGLAITIGLMTIGVGPWLLIGLLPLFIGLALVLAALVLRPEKAKADPKTKEEAPTPQPVAWSQEAVVTDDEQEAESEVEVIEDVEEEEKQEEDLPF